MTFDELKGRLDALDKRLDNLDERITSLLASVLVLQRNSLRLLGAGSLLGAIAIYVMARTIGVG